MAEQGKLLGGRYQLGSVLGRGGMAEVRRARDTRLSRDVAVKQLRIDLAGDPTFQARFRREAQAAAGLNHPNIVSVYDTGEELDEASGIKVPYIVMELVAGHTLRDILREGRKILPERALEMTMGVLDALQYSHQAGIIHRDIKPANIMLTYNGQVKVMDFGIARAVSDTAASMTQTAAVIGTAQYLSPEQARGETVDNRSDVYAAGCLMYELLVGEPPFTGDSPVSVAYQHVREIPVKPSHLDPVVTPAMDAIVMKALEKDPAKRYQSARDMRDDIARIFAGEQVTAAIPVPASEQPTAIVAPLVTEPAATPAPARPAVPARAIAPAPARRRSRTGTVIAILCLLLASALFAGYWFILRTPTPPPVAKVQVPQVVSMTVQNATATLEENKLKAQVQQVEGADDATVNTVVVQNPTRGTSVDQGSTVVITVNVGPAKVAIPDGLVGQNKDQVKTQLDQLGFTKVTLVEATTEPPTAVANAVITVNPASGAVIAKSTPITVTFATGKSAVPNLMGYSQQAAVQRLKDAGFPSVKVTERESTDSPGTVIDSDPKADTVVPRTTTVTIVIAKAAAPPTTVVTVTAQPTAPASSSTPSGRNS